MLEVAEGGSLHAFQFLIGTLKTQLLPAVVPSGPAFQFLIGTLKTTNHPVYLYTPVGVSIPHRYAKNKLADILGNRTIEVSIPHRYAKNG